MVQPVMRRAELMMVLAYASDLATGQTRDFAVRACVLAMRLARAAGLDETEHRNVFHQSLLRYIGCNADSHLLAGFFGDEFELRRDVGLNLGDPAERPGIFRRAISRAHEDLPAADFARAVEQDMLLAPQVTRPILAGHCEVAQRIGTRLGLSGDVLVNLGQLYERWDGKGMPHGINGDKVRIAVRLVTLAQDAVIHNEASGLDAMMQVIRRRRDGPYESDLADVLLSDAPRLMNGLDSEAGHQSILSLEPQPHASLNHHECEEAYLAIADMIDMRMPHTMGHSRAVAALADAAARRARLPEDEVRTLRWAAYVHDLGELAVPVATWLKPKPLSGLALDQMHLHPYFGERALASLGGDGHSVAELVLRHHERLDGSGYHRRARAGDLPPASRILAAAEFYQSARERRPHREALSDRAAATRLQEFVRDGRLCPDATAAVLAVAGHAPRRGTSSGLSALTPREVEILRLIVAGNTAKQAAEQLDISPKTAENHIQNLYGKINVTTRAGAALFAVEQGLANAA